MSRGDVLTADPPGEDGEFLRTLVSNAPVGLITFDGGGRIVFANPAVERILGYRPDELVGRTTTELVPERLRSTPGSDLERFVRGDVVEAGALEVEFPALHRDGHEVPVSVSLGDHVYRDDDLVTGVVDDVGDRKRRERSLREQNRELEEFADVLSHDLRNPLLVADNNVEKARVERDGEALRRVAEALDRLEQILEDTLVRSRRGPPVEATESVPLHEAARTAWDAVPTRDADLVVPDHAWHLEAHPGRLCQLAENLFRNAVEHAAPDTTVRVGVLDGGAGFYVEDDGPGLPPTVRTRLESGPEAVRDREGYGLRIVERVAEEHGWEVHPADADGGGARLEFRGASVDRR